MIKLTIYLFNIYLIISERIIIYTLRRKISLMSTVNQRTVYHFNNKRMRAYFNF